MSPGTAVLNRLRNFAKISSDAQSRGLDIQQMLLQNTQWIQRCNVIGCCWVKVDRFFRRLFFFLGDLYISPLKKMKVQPHGPRYHKQMHKFMEFRRDIGQFLNCNGWCNGWCNAWCSARSASSSARNILTKKVLLVWYSTVPLSYLAAPYDTMVQ